MGRGNPSSRSRPTREDHTARLSTRFSDVTVAVSIAIYGCNTADVTEALTQTPQSSVAPRQSSFPSHCRAAPPLPVPPYIYRQAWKLSLTSEPPLPLSFASDAGHSVQP